jgi:hypothetical protein
MHTSSCIVAVRSILTLHIVLNSPRFGAALGAASAGMIQWFYFGEDGLLRRHHYHVDIAGAFAAA